MFSGTIRQKEFDTQYESSSMFAHLAITLSFTHLYLQYLVCNSLRNQGQVPGIALGITFRLVGPYNQTRGSILKSSLGFDHLWSFV